MTPSPPRRKPLCAFPDRWTPEEQEKILAFCQREAAHYLPPRKPGGLRHIMLRMKNHYQGEASHVWRRDWVRAAYNWILKQVEIDAAYRRPSESTRQKGEIEELATVLELVKKADG
jgi:hypothetical protein